MNISSSLHQAAMEMSTYGDVARAKGFRKEAELFYQSAFQLENQVIALNENIKHEYPLSYFIPLRTAATLAYEGNLYGESLSLIDSGLKQDPPNWMVEELIEIKSLVQKKLAAPQKFSEQKRQIKIRGTVVQVNFVSNEIVVKANSLEQFAVVLSQKKMLDIVQRYLAKETEIEIATGDQGVIKLYHLQSAA